MEDCPLARTGSLLTSGTSLWCPVLPSRSPSGLLALSPSTLSRLSLVVTPYLSSASSHSRVTLLNCPRPLAGSSGFSPPHCRQASQALSPQYYTQICRPLPLSQLGFLPSRVRFMAPSGNNRDHDRRTSPGKIAPPPHIPSSFTSVRSTGYQDSLWYACSSSSPLPFSWFAVRYVHGFCLILPPDSPSLGMPLPCWRCPSVR